jgi:hypothetical protein
VILLAFGSKPCEHCGPELARGMRSQRNYRPIAPWEQPRLCFWGDGGAARTRSGGVFGAAPVRGVNRAQACLFPASLRPQQRRQHRAPLVGQDEPRGRLLALD